MASWFSGRTPEEVTEKPIHKEVHVRKHLLITVGQERARTQVTSDESYQYSRSVAPCPPDFADAPKILCTRRSDLEMIYLPQSDQLCSTESAIFLGAQKVTLIVPVFIEERRHRAAGCISEAWGLSCAKPGELLAKRFVSLSVIHF